MVRRETSERLFQARVEYLVADTSIEETARFYGRTPRTVRRWLDGSNAPSLAVKTSVSRRALSRGAAPALQVRIGGRFDSRGTIARSGTQRAIQVANLFTRRSREAQIREARATGNAERLAAARALPTRLDRRTQDNLALARERLMEQGVNAPSDRVEEMSQQLSDEEMDALDEAYYEPMRKWRGIAG